MRNNQGAIQYKQNQKENQAKNRRFKDNSFKPDPNWDCIYQVAHFNIKESGSVKELPKSELLLRTGVVYQYNSKVEQINSKSNFRIDTFKEIPLN